MSRTSGKTPKQTGPRGHVAWQDAGGTLGSTKTTNSLYRRRPSPRFASHRAVRVFISLEFEFSEFCTDGGRSPGSPVTEQPVYFLTHCAEPIYQSPKEKRARSGQPARLEISNSTATLVQRFFQKMVFRTSPSSLERGPEHYLPRRTLELRVLVISAFRYFTH